MMSRSHKLRRIMLVACVLVLVFCASGVVLAGVREKQPYDADVSSAETSDSKIVGTDEFVDDAGDMAASDAWEVQEESTARLVVDASGYTYSSRDNNVTYNTSAGDVTTADEDSCVVGTDEPVVQDIMSLEDAMAVLDSDTLSWIGNAYLGTCDYECVVDASTPDVVMATYTMPGDEDDPVVKISVVTVAETGAHGFHYQKIYPYGIYDSRELSCGERQWLMFSYDTDNGKTYTSAVTICDDQVSLCELSFIGFSEDMIQNILCAY